MSFEISAAIFGLTSMNEQLPASSYQPRVHNHHTFIIAEAGVNHNGSVHTARKMVDVAAATGADAIKFQTFKAEKVVARNAPKAQYQKATTGAKESQLEMVRKLELDEQAHKRLFSYCKQKNIQFLSTAFDLDSVDLLVDLGLNTFKIPSGDITNLPYLRKLGALNKTLIVSTGMADLEEVKNALLVLIEAGTAAGNITILHCNTEYPTPFEDVNLNAMLTMGAAFPGIKMGYSDHTMGMEVAIAAVAMGATVIEKHFTLDRTMEGPDHGASLEPHELKAMVSAIRNIEKAMGNGIKKPSPSELQNKSVVRKSIVANREIHVGELFTERNLTVKRPGNGLNPMYWDKVIGRVSNRDVEADDFILMEYLKDDSE